MGQGPSVAAAIAMLAVTAFAILQPTQSGEDYSDDDGYYLDDYEYEYEDEYEDDYHSHDEYEW